MYPSKSPITPRDVSQLPAPGWNIPSSLSFTPDDHLITYLFAPESNLVNRMFAFLPENGEVHELADPGMKGASEDHLSPEEKLRRERQRMMALGISQYQWANRKSFLLLPLLGSIFILDHPDQPLRQLVDGSQFPVLDPQISPDDHWVAYVQENELHVISISGGQPAQLTKGANLEGRTHGLAEYIAQEEMGRSHGFWWSPDSEWIAFEEVDDAHIPEYTIIHQAQAPVDAITRDVIRYPFAGKQNAHVRLGVVRRTGGDPLWLDLGEDPEQYIARVHWTPDGQLAVQVENREQTRLDLVIMNIHTGKKTILLTETSQTWINLHDMFIPLRGFGKSGEPGFIWASEKTGYRHLYLFDGIGRLIRPLTGGEWIVDSIAAVDQDQRKIYFTGTRNSPLESHLYMVDYDGCEARQITTQPGMHSVVIDHSHKRYIDTWHSIQDPPQITLRSLENNQELATLFSAQDPRIQEYALTPPRLVDFKNRSGVQLFGALYLPSNSRDEGPHPVVVLVYGGPHAQMVTNSWNMTSAMRAQYLRSLGFVVFIVDNRGSARRGLEFESAIRHDLGHLEVEDQEDGLLWLFNQGYGIPGHVGVCGWSYGGYMACRCLESKKGMFKAAIAGAPVTEWEGYDTHYTERYMGTPESNPSGYISSSVLNDVENITGKLLIIHGLIDENVHFRHSTRLIQAFISSGKPYQFLILPNARHSVRSQSDREYMEEKIGEFFLENL